MNLICACFLLNSYSCRQQTQAPAVENPVEVDTDQKVKHTPFQAAVSRFELQLARDVAEDGIGSISAGVVVENKVVWSKGFGWADVEKQVPAHSKTVYRTGSISKSFTAVLMMQMIEEGYFDLDDSVEKYFLEIRNLQKKPEVCGPITFRQLASHTAGLEREPKLKGAAAGPISQWEDKILASLPNTFYRSFPGEMYSYSNIGFGILGFAVSRAVRKPFMDLIREKIFEPLGMNSSFFILTEEHLPDLAMGYLRKQDGNVDAGPPAIEHAGRGYKVPNGGIYSTVSDLARFAAALTGASPVKIFSEEKRREILKQQNPATDKSRYGLGFGIRIDEDGFTTMGHGGSVAGYNAHLVFEPESKMGVIILRNYNSGKTNLGMTARQLLKELVQLRVA